MIDCYFEDGCPARIGLRHVTVITIVLDQNRWQLLLVKRAASLSTCPGLWALPGGFMDRDEKAVEAAAREVREETGYEIKGDLKFLGYDDSLERGDDRQNIPFIFVGVAGEKVDEADEESAAVQWFDLDDLPKREEWAFNHFEAVERYILKSGLGD